MARRSSSKDVTPIPNEEEIDTPNLVEGQAEQVKLVLESTQSPSYKTLYSNQVKIGISQWDMSLIMGQIVENAQGNSMVLEECSVKFSPMYFKNLVGALNVALQQWEALFGEIPVGLGQAHSPEKMAGAFEKLKGVLKNADKTPAPSRS